MFYKLLRLQANPMDVKYIEKICYFVLLSVVCILLIDMMSLFCEIPAFRHDELRYLDSYNYKLSTEGRWLNYLFFSVLKLSNIKIVAILNMIFFFVFSYKCFLNVFERKYALLCAMVSLFIPPIHLLNEWAQTSMLSFFLLAVAAIIYEKNVFAIILFGIFHLIKWLFKSFLFFAAFIIYKE